VLPNFENPLHLIIGMGNHRELSLLDTSTSHSASPHPKKRAFIIGSKHLQLCTCIYECIYIFGSDFCSRGWQLLCCNTEIDVLTAWSIKVLALVELERRGCRLRQLIIQSPTTAVCLPSSPMGGQVPKGGASVMRLPFNCFGILRTTPD